MFESNFHRLIGKQLYFIQIINYKIQQVLRFNEVVNILKTIT